MTANNLFHTNATNAYQKARDASLGPVEIVVALYQGILKNLAEAKTAYQEKDLGKMCQLNEKTFRILGALQCHLDFEKGGDTAPALDKFYTALFVRLARVMETPEPYLEYVYLEHTVRDIYDQWKKLAHKVAPPLKSPQKLS